MKKLRVGMFILLALMLALTFVLGACAKEEAPPPPAPAEKPWPEVVVVSVPGGPQSIMYIISAAFAKMIETHLDISTALTTTGGMDGVVLTTKGEIHFVFLNTPIGIPCITGTGAYETPGPQKIRAFMQGIRLEWNLVTLEGSGIESFADLKDKTVLGWPRPAADTVQPLFDTLLAAHGLEEADLKTASPWDTVGEAVDALKARTVDAIMYPATHPAPGLIDLATTHPIRVIHIDDAHMAKATEELVWLSKTTIPGGTYKGMDEDIQVPCYLLFMVCQKNLPDSFVYEAVKMVFENLEEFHASGPPCKYFRPEGVEDVTTVPYHPGAIKYYKEVGVWTTEIDELQTKLLEMIPPEYR